MKKIRFISLCEIKEADLKNNHIFVLSRNPEKGGSGLIGV